MFNEIEKQELEIWYNKVLNTKHVRNQHSSESERRVWIKNNPCPLEDKITQIYHSGHGFKTIGKNLNLSYSVTRKLCIDYIGINHRKGTSVVTDELRKKRRENVLGEKSPWYDWPRKMPELLIKNGKTIQGYYVKKDGSKVWLRSTYEYVIAKWLDKLDKEWKTEEKCYVLSNGERYRPDFFIYENNKLHSIVEVKSRYFNKDNREYKFHMLKKEYDIECLLITDITKFTDKTYHQEIKEWKKIRLLVK